MPKKELFFVVELTSLTSYFDLFYVVFVNNFLQTFFEFVVTLLVLIDTHTGSSQPDRWFMS
jgi:hypothetical protein